jgi:peptide/nickel transport system substrate-binding protein
MALRQRKVQSHVETEPPVLSPVLETFKSLDAYPWPDRSRTRYQDYYLPGCKQPLNYAGYCSAETDALLNQSRAERDPVKRKKIMEQISAQVLKDRPVIYLYHRNWLWAYNGKLAGVRNIPDGLLRVSGLKMAP